MEKTTQIHGIFWVMPVLKYRWIWLQDQRRGAEHQGSEPVPRPRPVRGEQHHRHIRPFPRHPAIYPHLQYTVKEKFWAIAGIPHGIS
jgi:hypothetical protein